jgi:hypothetical protein
LSDQDGLVVAGPGERTFTRPGAISRKRLNPFHGRLLIGVNAAAVGVFSRICVKVARCPNT